MSDEQDTLLRRVAIVSDKIETVAQDGELAAAQIRTVAVKRACDMIVSTEAVALLKVIKELLEIAKQVDEIYPNLNRKVA